MENYNLVEETVDIQRVFVFDEIYRMLAVEIYDDVPCIATFPVYLNDQIVIPRVKLHPYRTISVAVDEVIDICTKLVGRFIYLQHYKPDH